MDSFDFVALNNALVSRSLEFLQDWFPNGKLEGREYTLGNLSGNPGKSLKINIDSGRWADFASNESGGDYVSLYAAKERISQGDAYKILAPKIGMDLPVKPDGGNGSKRSFTTHSPKLTIPPKGKVPPIDGAENTYIFRNVQGEPLFYIARFRDDKRKRFVPYSWSDNHGWVMKSWPAPRPLYGLDRLAKYPNKRILIVEGEKCVEAIRKLNQSIYEPITWSNGTNSVDKAEWSSVFGRSILIWPDADPAGVKAAHKIASKLAPHCPEIKIIDVSGIDKQGWDIADAIDSGGTWKDITEWARPRAKLYKPTIPKVIAPQKLTKPIPTITVSEDLGPPPGQEMKDFWESCGLAMTGKEPIHPIQQMDNVLRVLERYEKFKDFIWFDEFHQKYFTRWGSDKQREWEDTDFIILTSIFQRHFGFIKIPYDMVTKAVIAFASYNKKNEVKEWLDTLQWDKTPRIDMFLSDCMGADKSEYTISASKNFWISMVARIYKPGEKVDNMLVFEGVQGTFKSTALQIIGGEWFAEAHDSITNKDFYLSLQGKLLIEISELGSFPKSEQAAIKRAVSCPKDRFRRPYGMGPKDYPRKCVFVGTTNEEFYLDDPTGGRRFWPIEIGEIDTPTIARNRNQLFAEAIVRFKNNEPWWIMPESTTTEKQDSRRMEDPWEGPIKEWLAVRTEQLIKLSDIIDLHGNGPLNLELSKANKPTTKRIVDILKNNGWKNIKPTIGGKQTRCWMKKKS